METSNFYEVPLVQNDLRSEETIVHVLGALTQLSKVSNDIFSKIDVKCTEFQQKIFDVNKRVDSANAKIDALKEAKKATVVFSSAKYPGNEKHRDYESIFAGVDQKQEYAHPRHNITERPQEFNLKNLQGKLQFFTVKEKPKDKSIPKGLGSIPSNLSSASSLTVYNTAESPYNDSVKADPLEAKLKMKKQNLEESDRDKNNMDETDFNKGLMNHEENDNLFYNPDMGDLPDFDLPDDLELPNIAQDMQYSLDIGPGIAPTMNLQDLPEILEDLPDLGGGENVEENDKDTTTQSQPGPPPPPPSSNSAPPVSNNPPPPPPPANIPPPPPSAPAAPPPPPPPANIPPPPPVSDQTDEKSEEAPKSAPPPDSDARGGLLDAIRKAGGASGAGLKSIKERKAEERKKRDEAQAAAPSSSGGDLMGDLMSKLTMRRKGISGAKAVQEEEPAGAMDKISMMIPPPPQAGGANDSGSDEEDWD